jgi:hypothetical protein
VAEAITLATRPRRLEIMAIMAQESLHFLEDLLHIASLIASKAAGVFLKETSTSRGIFLSTVAGSTMRLTSMK